MAYVKGKPQPNLKRAKLAYTGNKARCWHFKNRAARQEAIRIYSLPASDAAAEIVRALCLQAVDSMALRIVLMKEGKLRPSLFLPVDLILATHAPLERRAGTPRPPAPSFAIGKNLSLDEFADLVVALAQINGGKGFRQPSAKPGKWLSTSLVEGVMRACGRMGKPEFELSDRGKRKQEVGAEMKAAILKQRKDGIDPKYLSAHQRHLLAMKEAAQ
jgi:hypothetical protein